MLKNLIYTVERFIKSQAKIDSCVCFLGIILGGVDLVSNAFLAIIASVIIMKCDAVRSFWYIATLLFLYFLIRILNFHINKKIEKLSLNFRYNEISNIASKILKTNYEKLQGEEEQNHIAGAYYAVLSGSNAGIEFHVNETYRLLSNMLAFLIVLIPGTIIFPQETLIILFCNVLLLFFLNRKTKVDAILTKEINNAKTKAKNVLKQSVDKKNNSDIYLYDIQGWLFDRYDERRKQQFKIENRQYQKSLIYSVLTVVVSVSLFSYSLWVIQNTEYIDGIVAYVYLLVNMTAMCKQVYLHLANIVNNNNFIEEWRAYCEENIDKSVESIFISDIESVRFEDISYSVYGKKNIINKVSLEIKKGEKIAFVGRNGAGKTTLIKILLGLIQPTEGKIFVNGSPVSYDEYSSLVSKFGYIPQENSIFAFSVATNIILGKYNDSLTNSINNAMLRVGIKDVVNKLSKKENTYIGRELDEDGIEFSGGEKRKLLIARGMYHNREINIYDEPTSSLDSKSERDFYEQIEKESENFISIFVSHRIGTTNFCNIVYVLQNGKIVQKGNGEELLNVDGVYKELFESQIMETSYEKSSLN